MSEMSRPALSLITPVWNGMEFFQETVASVFAQDFGDWEWIIGDNGSTDGTREYLDTLDDPRIRVLKHPQNLGIFGNLNALFREASTPVAFILCADDYLLSGGLACALKRWKESTEDIAFIRFNWSEEKRGVSLRRLSYEVVPSTVHPADSDLFFFLFGNMPGILTNNMVRVDRVLETGGWREDLPYAGDFEMWSRLGHRWPFKLLEDDVSYARRHPGVASLYLNRKGELIAQVSAIVSRLYGWLREAGYPGWLLRVYATVQFDVRQRDNGLKVLSQTGNWEYLLRVTGDTKNASHFLSPLLRWVAYVLTAGARVGVLPLARVLLRRRLLRRSVG